jgi:hypothetical protein
MNASLLHTGVTLLHIHERPGGARQGDGMAKAMKARERMWAVLQGGSDSRECRLEARILRYARD